MRQAGVGGGGVIKGCTDIKQEMLGIRGRESNLEPGIVMDELIESAGEKKAVVRPKDMRTILVEIHQNEKV